MALEDIIKEINESTESKIKEINDSTDEQISKINSDKDNEIKSYKDQMDKKAKAILSQIQIEAQSRTNMDSKRLYDEKVEEKLNDAFTIIKDSYSDIRKTPTYKKVLNKIVSDSVEKLGKDAIISINSKDKDLIDANGINIKVDDAIVGGVRAVSKDGSKEIDETLDNIIDDVKDQLAMKFLKQIK